MSPNIDNLWIFLGKSDIDECSADSSPCDDNPFEVLLALGGCTAVLVNKVLMATGKLVKVPTQNKGHHANDTFS